MYFFLFDAGNTYIKCALARHAGPHGGSHAGSPGPHDGSASPAVPGAAGLSAAPGGPALPGALEGMDILPTPSGRDIDTVCDFLRGMLASCKIAPTDVGGCLCSSVVPQVDVVLARAVRDLCGTKTLFAPRTAPVPLETPYAPGQLGADRLVAAYAARKLYPDAPELMTVDFGTATTFNYISGNTYVGGLICPGVDSAAEGLAAHTAKLSKVQLTKDVDTSRVLGTSTRECMESGFLHGFAAMADGVIERIAASRHPEGNVFPLVVATGGMASILAPVCRRLTHVTQNLVLTGLNFLAQDIAASSPASA